MLPFAMPCYGGLLEIGEFLVAVTQVHSHAVTLNGVSSDISRHDLSVKGESEISNFICILFLRATHYFQAKRRDLNSHHGYTAAPIA
jgi:hypothetical protein